MNIKSTNMVSNKWIIFLTFFALFIYIILRAVNLSFTHDESLSYAILFDNAISSQTANNHILNTLFMWISSLFFGRSEFALRLPNVLSFGIYLFSCYYILKESKNSWHILLGSSLLILNPFLIDFFSLARGYGISMGCMMLSLYFFLRKGFNYPSYNEFIKDYKLTITFASLAVFANLSMINYLIACILIFFIQYMVLKKTSSNEFTQPINKSIIFITIIPLTLGILMLLFLNLKNQLYIGEKNLLGTLNSIIENSFYFSTYPFWVLNIIKYLAIIFYPIGIISIILKKDYFGRFFIITLLILFIISGLIIEHFIFHANYPEGRTALYFIPLFGFFNFYFILHIRKYYFQKIGFIIICSLGITSLLLFHFINNINFLYTKTWQYDAHTKEVILIIEPHINNTLKTTISNDWFFEPSLNYYINSRKINLNPSTRNEISLTSDFIYKVIDNKPLTGFETLSTYKDINTILLKKK